MELKEKRYTKSFRRKEKKRIALEQKLESIEKQRKIFRKKQQKKKKRKQHKM